MKLLFSKTICYFSINIENESSKKRKVSVKGNNITLFYNWLKSYYQQL